MTIMALKLKSVRLRNWKCYENEEIQFNLDTDKRIWIVFGQNGFGKTSLLEAIQWCLYGSETISPTELLDRFNRIAIKENPQLELSVQLTFECEGESYDIRQLAFEGDFESNNNTYDISRTAKRVVRGTTASAQVYEAIIQKNGINQADVRERIEELLPKSCKEFFFFDGVEIKRYAQRLHTQETLKAIERILGIPELRNLREDAERAMQNLQKKLERAASAKDSLKQETLKLEDIQEEIKTKREQLQIAKEEYEEAVNILKSTHEEAKQIQALRGKLDDLARLERGKTRLQEDLNEAEEQVESALRKAPIPLLIEFVREVADDMQSTTITTARRSGSVAQLQEILEDGTCVCGHCIDEKARQHILKELERLQSRVSRTQDALRQDDLRNRLVTLSRFQSPNFDELLDRRDRLRDQMDETQQAAYRLRQETKGINEEEAQEIWKKVGEAEQIAREKKEKIDRLNREIEELKQQEDKQSREIEKLAGHNKETANLAQQVKLARGLSKAAEELIEWRIAERKETIETRTSELHRRVTNKPNEYVGVEIREDYTLGVKNAVGEILNPETLSAGEKEALAFAFIAGLNLASGTAAPLIMDTPFGHLDTDHQKNLINSLPEIPSQVIVLATDRDFPDSLLKGVRPHVAGILKIRRLGATEDASTVEVEQ
jgi:DNA sulfur modification protein DndD